MTPQPFCFNKSRVRALVLGADPTNFSDHGNSVQLHYDFGIGQDPRYFNGILKNLNRLGLHLEDLFIDNLLPGYQEKETGDNKNFVKDARRGVAELLKRFSKVKGSKNLPVYLTSYEVYKVVMKEGEQLYPASGLYNLQTEIPIPAFKNLLNRPLIPLFRHKRYELKVNKAYGNHIREFLSMTSG